MERSIWIVGVFALLLFLGAIGTGYAIQDPSENGLHLGLALAAGVLLGFTQIWFVLYLLLTGRLLHRHLGDESGTEIGANGGEDAWEDPLHRARLHRRRTVPPAIATVVGLLALVVLGTRLPIQPGALVYHHAVSWLTFAAAVGALVTERRVARDHSRLLGEVDARIADTSTT